MARELLEKVKFELLKARGVDPINNLHVSARTFGPKPAKVRKSNVWHMHECLSTSRLGTGDTKATRSVSSWTMNESQ